MSFGRNVDSFPDDEVSCGLISLHAELLSIGSSDDEGESDIDADTLLGVVVVASVADGINGAASFFAVNWFMLPPPSFAAVPPLISIPSNFKSNILPLLYRWRITAMHARQTHPMKTLLWKKEAIAISFFVRYFP